MSLCESCHAGCCRTYVVPLSGADIIRIERQLGLPFLDFVCRWSDPQGQIARNYAPHFHFSDEPQTPFVLSLIHDESDTFADTTKCRFLIESPPDQQHPLGLGRCGIYGQRPSACRVFPTKLNETGELAVIFDVPERGRSQDTPAYNLCPRQWEPADLDPLETLQDLVVAKYEMSFFKQVALVWNRKPRPWSLFPDFLHLAYSRRVLHEADLQETEIEESDAPHTIPLPTNPQPRASSKAA